MNNALDKARVHIALPRAVHFLSEADISAHSYHNFLFPVTIIHVLKSKLDPVPVHDLNNKLFRKHSVNLGGKLCGYSLVSQCLCKFISGKRFSLIASIILLHMGKSSSNLSMKFYRNFRRFIIDIIEIRFYF